MAKNKIKTIKELADIIEKGKKSGEKFVLSHGCFDLVHVGHMKHFNEAKKMADFLIVTVTPDRFINKGPGRPVFNETLRMEALSNLEAVDYVALNDSPDAVSLIKRLKPNFYIKGDEYMDLKKDDPTAMRWREKEAVESCGGKLVFTSEKTFSSTNLLKQGFDYLPKEVSDFFNPIRKKYSRENIAGFIEKLGKLKVLVIGDPIIDEYVYCQTVGTVSKSPTISAVFKNNLKMAGAALAIARHVAEFAESVEYIGVAGEKDKEAGFIKGELEKSKVKCNLVEIPNRFTTLKRRFISGNYPTVLGIENTPMDEKMYKLFEISLLDNSFVDKDVEKEICQLIKQKAKESDLVILADFGHGMITPKVMEVISKESKWWAVNAQTNSTNFGFNLITKYKKPNFVCIDELEARLPLNNRVENREKVVGELSKLMDCKEIMMSMSREGLLLKNDKFHYAPALAKKTIDTVGAGDAVLSMASLCCYLKFPPEITVLFSAIMGALATNIICNQEPVKKKNFLKFLNGSI